MDAGGELKSSRLFPSCHSWPFCRPSATSLKTYISAAFACSVDRLAGKSVSPGANEVEAPWLCTYTIYGCSDPTADNYAPWAKDPVPLGLSYMCQCVPRRPHASITRARSLRAELLASCFHQRIIDLQQLFGAHVLLTPMFTRRRFLHHDHTLAPPSPQVWRMQRHGSLQLQREGDVQRRHVHVPVDRVYGVCPPFPLPTLPAPCPSPRHARLPSD